MEQKTLNPQTLALYLGCQVAVPEENNKVGRLTGIDWHKGEDDDIVILDIRYSDKKDDWTVLNENSEITRVKPILRRLSSMTDEEADHVWHLEEPNAILEMVSESGRRARKVVLAPSRMAYLLSKGFDLFGLIDSGLAQEKI